MGAKTDDHDSKQASVLWKVVQNHPSEMYFPEGEGLAQMQVRAMRALRLAAAGKGTQLLISHGDVIKSIVAGVLGTHLDNFQKIVIDPASITVLDLDGSTLRLLTLNNTASPITEFVISGSKRKSARALIGGGSGGQV